MIQKGRNGMPYLNVQKKATINSLKSNIKKMIQQRQFWIAFWGIQLIVEYLLFRTYVFRENVDTIPRYFDQTTYLLETYKAYFLWLNGNYSEAISKLFFESFNSAAPTLNAILLFLFGYSRFSLLLFNFLGLVVMQYGGGYLVYRLFENRKLQCAYNGSVLMLGVHFIYAADLTDYRLDYVAACLMTVFLLSYMGSILTKNNKYFALAALLSGMLIFVRFNTVLYVVIIVLITELIKICFKQSNFYKSVISVVQFGLLCIVGGGWSVLTNFKNFFEYYTKYHLGETSKLWEYKSGIVGQLLFYPKALVDMHLGKALFGIGLILILLTIILCFIKKHRFSVEKRITLSSLLVILLIQLAILTKDTVKVNTTASSMVGACIIIMIFFMHEMTLINKGYRVILYISSVLILVLGMKNYFVGTTTYHAEPHDKNIDKIYEKLDEYIVETGKTEFVYLMDLDATYDLILPANMSVYEYEKRKKTVNFSVPSSETFDIFGITEDILFTEEEMLNAVDECDIVFITKDGYGVEVAADYSINESWIQHRRAVREYLNRNNKFHLLLDTTVNGHEVAVFAKNIVDINVTGIYSDGWSGREIFIKGFDSASDVDIQFKASATSFVGRTGNKVKVFVDGKMVNTVDVDCIGENINLNDLVLKEIHGEEIRLEIEEMICPLDEQIGVDPRQLGILVDIKY